MGLSFFIHLAGKIDPTAEESGGGGKAMGEGRSKQLFGVSYNTPTD